MHRASWVANGDPYALVSVRRLRRRLFGQGQKRELICVMFGKEHELARLSRLDAIDFQRIEEVCRYLAWAGRIRLVCYWIGAPKSNLSEHLYAVQSDGAVVDDFNSKYGLWRQVVRIGRRKRAQVRIAAQASPYRSALRDRVH